MLASSNATPVTADPKIIQKGACVRSTSHPTSGHDAPSAIASAMFNIETWKRVQPNCLTSGKMNTPDGSHPQPKTNAITSQHPPSTIHRLRFWSMRLTPRRFRDYPGLGRTESVRRRHPNAVPRDTVAVQSPHRTMYQRRYIRQTGIKRRVCAPLFSVRESTWNLKGFELSCPTSFGCAPHRLVCSARKLA